MTFQENPSKIPNMLFQEHRSGGSNPVPCKRIEI